MRRYDLVCFDMDGTLTKLRSSWCWLHNCFGVDNEDAYQAFVNGEIDEPEFMRRDIALWKGACPDIRIGDLVRHFQSMPLIDGIQETVACLRENGIRSVIISGGIDTAAKMLKEEFGFDDFVADEICSHADGSLTGEGKMNVDLSDKGIWVREFMNRYGTTMNRTVSVGNSFTDISMFNNSGMSIAFNPVDVYTEEAATHVVKSSNISEILDLILPCEGHSSS
ncbi:MAG: HAD-IB family phosphatase [Candidatus Methanoplasma sp.]|jgi:phosphoserine phosphatase|nr:HAD-IB family phosphatase [Candidatus Methanoplasma sp.]